MRTTELGQHGGASIEVLPTESADVNGARPAVAVNANSDSPEKS
jgi:hypothetical protein